MSQNTISEVLKIFNNDWNKQVVLYGPPGTSKTYSSRIIAALWLADIRIEEDEEVDSKKGILKEKTEKLLEQINEKEIKDKANELMKKGSISEIAEAYLLCNPKNYKLVQFHPSYSYEDFVRGITVKPENGKITYETEAKIIEKFSKEIGEDRGVLIIDEINRAPLASVLGELIYGLEYRGNEITTPYELPKKNKVGEPIKDSREPLIIPENLYIIGTMNTADRSIGSMDYAVRRRFAFVPVLSSGEKIKDTWNNASVKKIASELYEKLIIGDKDKGIFNKDKFITDPELDVNDIKIGHTYFLGKNDDEEIKEKEYLKYRVQYQILPIYREYVKDGLVDREGLSEFKNVLTEIKDLFTDEEINALFPELEK